jgi:predicted Rossmann-fold nucleotide-binding protein
VILYGTAYWTGLIDWLRSSMLPDGKINEVDLDLIQLCDDVDEIVDIIQRSQSSRSDHP